MMATNFQSSKETTNFARICRLVIDVIPNLLGDLLNTRLPASGISAVLNTQRKKILSRLMQHQKNILYPQGGVYQGSVKDLDTSLLYILLRNLGNIPPHQKGWGKVPDIADRSLSANIDRLREQCNEAAHASNASLSDVDFQTRWGIIRQSVKEIQKSELNTGRFVVAVDDILTMEMDHRMTNKYIGEFLLDIKEDMAGMSVKLDTMETDMADLQVAEKDLPEEILQMDQRSIQLYRKCLEEEEEADYHLRVIVIGQTGVGKTTLTRNLLRLPRIRPSEKTMSTDGVDIHSSFVSLHDNSWITTDTEMQKASKSHDAKLIKLFRSSTSLKNEESVISAEADPKTKGESSDQISTPKENWKSDDESFNHDESDNEVLAVEKAKSERRAPANDPFIKTVRDLIRSQKDSKADLDDMNYGELSVWDFAGQFVFYTTHHTFLTPRAVYLLVTRLDQSLHDTVDNDQWFLDATGCKEMKIGDLVSYWMNSVHIYSPSVDHVPPVILVGTHLDKVEGDTENKTNSYFEELRKSQLNKPTSCHLIDRDYTVSNTPDEQEIESLRQKIVELASKQKYWGETIPARWIALEKAMMEQKVKGVSVMSYEEVVELDKSTGVPINDKEKLDLFLRFQHAIGNMIYFSEGCLRDHIVLNPQWLIDAFKCIITARQFCIKNPALVQHWDELNSTGRLHQGMVEAIFGKEDRFCLHKEHILGLMERLDIISRPCVYQDADTSHPELQDFYFVPSLLRGKLTECQLNNFVQNTNRTPFLCYAFKNNFLPPAVFHRLLAACLSKYPVAKQGSQFLMFCGCGIFDLKHGLTRLVVTFYDNIIQIGLFRFSTKKCSPESSTCVSVRKFVTETLKRVLGRYCMNLPFTLSLKCEEGRLLSHEGMMSVEDVTSGEEEVVCHSHDNKSHLINRQRHLQAWFPDEISATDISPENNGDHFMCLNFGQLSLIPDDQELARISAKIGEEFVILAGFLGIDTAEIFQIRSDHQYDTKSQIYHTLVRWKQKSGSHATYQCLMEAFRNSDISVEILSGP